MKNSLYFVILNIIIFGCKIEENNEVILVELEPSSVVSEIDSLFFVRVSLSSYKKNNFILSQYPSFLAKTNSMFEPLWVYDEEGEGPTDLNYPEQLIIKNEKIFVLDHGNQSLKTFNLNDGDFLSSFRIPESVMKNRFDISRTGNFYFSILGLNENNSVIEVDPTGNLVKHIGVKFPETGIGSNRQMKYFQLDKNDNLILIGASLPYVEILNKSGKTINRFSLDEFEPIKRALDSMENDILTNKRGNQSNSIPSYIIDAQYVNGRLYVSFTDRIGLDRTKARNLLEFKLDDKDCKLVRVYKFKTGTQDDGFHPANFYVDGFNRKLLAQGLITKQIYEFKLPD
jgi:hypothetical protein